VIFTQDVTGCTYVAAAGAVGVGLPPIAEAAVASRGGNANGVLVAMRSSAGVLADASFHLIVVC
jgi:hypothetical protein